MKEMHVCVLLFCVLVEMWPPSRSIVTLRKLTDVEEIFEVPIINNIN